MKCRSDQVLKEIGIINKCFQKWDSVRVQIVNAYLLGISSDQIFYKFKRNIWNHKDWWHTPKDFELFQDFPKFSLKIWSLKFFSILETFGFQPIPETRLGPSAVVSSSAGTVADTPDSLNLLRNWQKQKKIQRNHFLEIQYFIYFIFPD